MMLHQIFPLVEAGFAFLVPQNTVRRRGGGDIQAEIFRMQWRKRTDRRGETKQARSSES